MGVEERYNNYENPDSMDEDWGEDEDTQKDKYLLFHLMKEFYAIEIKYVIEIIGIQKITEIPEAPNFVKGIINLRGKVIPVIDVRLRFKFLEKAYEDRTCIIVVDVNQIQVGLIVDQVSEVMDIPPNRIELPPKTNKGSHSRFIKGLGKIGSEVKILLDMDKLLNDDEIQDIESIMS